MPKLIGAFRVKNEQTFLEKTLEEACNYCDEIAVIDDWSEDKTVEVISDICYSHKKPYRIIKSPDKRYHEGRDRDLLLQLVISMDADWCLQIDADEVYEQVFVKNLQDYMNSDVNVIWVYATHLWSLEEKLWYEVDTFRCDSGWSTSFLEDGTGVQHARPALFKINPMNIQSGSLRDHGYLCPTILSNSDKTYHSEKIFAHFGYSIPSLVKVKCIRHGSIPAVTSEEIEGSNYEPGWIPNDYNREAAINEFKRVWLNKDKVELKQLKRRIWNTLS